LGFGMSVAASRHLPMDRLTARKIAILYALGAGIWIVGSDTVLTSLWDDASSHWLYGIVKGIAFVVLTTTLLYWLLISIGVKEQAKYRTCPSSEYLRHAR
jgi:hypothetical protein